MTFIKKCLHSHGGRSMSFPMPNRPSSGALLAVFAAVAGLAAYEFVPRKVEVNVASLDRIFAGKTEIARYLITDKHQSAFMRDPSQFHISANGAPQPQKAVCIQSRSIFGGPAHLHDCEPGPF
jgi:hypothetical protein